MARAPRTLHEEEKALWQAVARTVKPLAGRSPSESPTPEPLPASPVDHSSPAPVRAKPARHSVPLARERPAPVQEADLFRQFLSGGGNAAGPARRPTGAHDLYVGARAPGLDTTQWRRLTRGRMALDGRLDLHGYVVQEAFELFLAFMARARRMNWRCVEIVTGMGSGPEGGAIRRELRHWLQRGEIRPSVLAVVHPHAANQGAVRILLRRKR
ncbi:Smr/MutS family protein [Oecophyllibacter saccharovorans]|uniref:Smr/MutS family protein n=1 Tax=Oecophyllibacter saccharovorans TaxID=2558360 RepID=UPI0011669AF5|nr:Smr/MutS family protein [Oecophyllibacter saccharovorans]TPW36730.1 DNA mismatch repair protein MutS [Oecophyllibacter saccharovorans]